MNTDKCYFCGEKVTTREHVPPKCLFPETNNCNDINYRVNLITVPSCDKHNSEKSKDDEYLHFILTSLLGSNQIANYQFSKKIIKLFKRRPYIARTFIQNPENIWVKENGLIVPSISYTVDITRFYSSLEHIARGLIYSTSGTILNDKKIQIVYTSATFSSISDEKKISLAKFVIKTKDFLNIATEYQGNNQKIFKYKVLSDDSSYIVFFIFYEMFEVLVSIKNA